MADSFQTWLEQRDPELYNEFLRDLSKWGRKNVVLPAAMAAGSLMGGQAAHAAASPSGPAITQDAPARAEKSANMYRALKNAMFAHNPEELDRIYNLPPTQDSIEDAAQSILKYSMEQGGPGSRKAEPSPGAMQRARVLATELLTGKPPQEIPTSRPRGMGGPGDTEGSSGHRGGSGFF